MASLKLLIIKPGSGKIGVKEGALLNELYKSCTPNCAVSFSP